MVISPTGNYWGISPLGGIKLGLCPQTWWRDIYNRDTSEGNVKPMVDICKNVYLLHEEGNSLILSHPTPLCLSENR